MFEPIYNLSQDKLLALQKHIDKNLEKGFIWHSKFPVGVPILFLKKKNGFLHMCVNYCGLNWLIIKNWYLLPLISRLLDRLNHAKINIKIDLRGTYNLVHIRESDEWKWHSKFVTTILNMLWCLLVLLMHILFFNIWWMMFSMNIWMILRFVTSMTFSFFRRTWQTMNAM